MGQEASWGEMPEVTEPTYGKTDKITKPIKQN